MFSSPNLQLVITNVIQDGARQRAPQRGCYSSFAYFSFTYVCGKTRRAATNSVNNQVNLPTAAKLQVRRHPPAEFEDERLRNKSLGAHHVQDPVV
jgi:hypothetical protein